MTYGQDFSGLVGRVVARYLDDNPDVAVQRTTVAEVGAAWHVTTELAQHVDSMLRAWHVPARERMRMAQSMLEQVFGTPEGRHGAMLKVQALLAADGPCRVPPELLG